MINIKVQCPVLLWIWLHFELMCDDSRNTVLMMPPSFSHYYLEEDRGRDKKDVEMPSLDVEIMK